MFLFSFSQDKCQCIQLITPKATCQVTEVQVTEVQVTVNSAMILGPDLI